MIRHVRPKYACRCCERIFQAAAPDLPIDKGRPGPGLLANIAVSKYCDGLPLYRQSAILAREGIDIDRTTMADWMGHLAWWAMPLYRLIGTHVMAAAVLYTDDTPIRRLAPGLGRTVTARFWVYAVDPRTYDGRGPPAAFYRYSPDRKGERPRDHLAGFSGLPSRKLPSIIQDRARRMRPPTSLHISISEADDGPVLADHNTFRNVGMGHRLRQFQTGDRIVAQR